MSPFPQRPNEWWEQGYLFLSANLNKRGITLNLGDERGRELFLRLASLSDVVVENFTPRVLENFKLTYDAIREVRPDVGDGQHARVGPGGSLARPPGLRDDYGAGIRHGLRHRLQRWAADDARLVRPACRYSRSVRRPRCVGGAA